jgi:hypothetical protein
MRRFRVFIFLLLSIVVPLQGYAHVALPEVQCPMEQTALMGGADEAHDCCHEGEGDTQCGKACKSCQPCHALGQHLFPASSLGVLIQQPASSILYPHAAGFKPSFDPAATWRPPAAPL